jgi:hypothetical protein
MIGPALLFAVLMSILSTALLAGGLLAAKTYASRSAAAYAGIAADGAVQALRRALALQIAGEVARAQAGSVWPPSHEFAPPPPDANDSACADSCALIVKTTWAPAIASGPMVPVRRLQRRLVDEQRVAATVTVTVEAARGDVLARRERLVTLRVLDTPPYALVDGELDTSVALDVPPGAAQGDVAAGGTLPVNVKMACERVDPANDASPAANSGLPWGVTANNHAAHEALCEGSLSAVDQFADGTWSNGNVAANGWTR